MNREEKAEQSGGMGLEGVGNGNEWKGKKG